jgi:hypothetical protein
VLPFARTALIFATAIAALPGECVAFEQGGRVSRSRTARQDAVRDAPQPPPHARHRTRVGGAERPRRPTHQA